MGVGRQKTKDLLNWAVPDRYFINRCTRDKNGVYLTFDDGPHPVWTPRSMDVLEQYDIKATYFLVGQDAMRHAGIVKDIVRRGHTVGNHTYSHRSVVGMGTKDLEVEILENRKRLSDLIGQDVKLFRPPWGRLDFRSAAYIILRGQQIVMWSLDSTDYKMAGAGAIIDWIDNAGVGAGDIMLFHDDNPQTMTALPEVIEIVQRNGLCFNNLTNI
jgi:peptidoglycan/xylan/chitin deacetylase (PgdA/CDA1 family)